MMTDTEIIIEVAKLDGLNAEEIWAREQKEATLRLLGTPSYGFQQQHVPPYLTSRDAIIPVVEKHWHTFDKKAFFNHVNRRMGNHICDADDIGEAIFTHPRQLCIALLKSTGRWRE